MTDRDKLNKIFEAALKAPEADSKSRPQPTTMTMRSAPVAPDRQQPTEQNKPAATAPETSAMATANKTQPMVQEEKEEVSGAHDADEVGKVLEEKLNKEQRSRKIKSLVNIVVVVGVLGGGAGWFFSSAERRDGLFNIAKEIRNATDAKKVADGYNKSLDKVAARGSQLDQATSAMGVSTDAPEGEDGHMDAEMRGMMGGEGTTTGDRAKAMEKSFGKRADGAGGTYKPKAEMNKDNSFGVE